MLRLLATLALAAIITHLHAAQADPPPADVRFAVIKTAKLPVKEGMVFSGGSFSKEVDTNFSAFLVKHNDVLFLFDSGLGSQVAEQYRQDMPWWNRPFFRYQDPVVTARQQLDAAGLPAITRIVLSHAHWDHASGLDDFPGAEVWLSEEELAFVHQPSSGVGSAWPSQVSAKPVAWKVVPFQPTPHEGFEHSFDMFGDGSVVLVPMFGHTPGSIGMFVTASSGQRYFFVGDVVWNAGALKEGRPKFWAARAFVDHEAAQTLAMVEHIRDVMKRNPGIVIVPAHDGGVQDALGYFPQWVR